MTDEPPPGSARLMRGNDARVAFVGRLPEAVGRVALESLATRLLERVGRADAALSVRFACDRTVRRFNCEHRGIDRATDVLSFPMGDEIDGTPYLGDLLISRERVQAQARRAGSSARRETEELLIHGVLHLLGYDHETDDGEMIELELELRRELLGRAESCEVGR